MTIPLFDPKNPDRDERQRSITLQRKRLWDEAYVSDEGSENYMAVFMNSDDSAVMQIPVWRGENDTLLVKVNGAFETLTNETKIPANAHNKEFRFVRLTDPGKGPRITIEEKEIGDSYV